VWDPAGAGAERQPGTGGGAGPGRARGGGARLCPTATGLLPGGAGLARRGQVGWELLGEPVWGWWGPERWRADPWHPAWRRYVGGALPRSPIISIISRDTGECRFWVCDHVTKHTCYDLIAANVPVASTILNTDEWQSYGGSHPSHATVRRAVHEWARDDDGDGRREVHCNTCEEAGAACAPICGPFEGSTSNTCISMWQPTKRC
jgi:hypothetical protein